MSIGDAAPEEVSGDLTVATPASRGADRDKVTWSSDAAQIA